MTAAILPPIQTAALPGASVLDDPIEVDRCTRWVTGRDGARLAESTLQVSGMYCAACAGIIESALQSDPGVHLAQVMAATQRATVRWDPARTRLSGLLAMVERAGYGAVPDAAAPARELRRREHRAALWRLFVASFCAMQVMMFATPSYVAAEGDLGADMRQLLNWGGWIVSLPVMWFAAGPFFRAAWRQVRGRRIGMDVPIALALGVTFVASMGATFDPGGLFGQEVYFDSLTMFLSFLLGARFVELRARHRAADNLERALARMPESAERQADDGSWERVSTRRLKVGDVVRVVVGQAFPADGPLLQGHTRVDESVLTGESDPVPREAGQAVVAGSLNRQAPVVMRVERVGADTRFEAIVDMMRQAMSQRPDAARLADRWAGVFLGAVLALALGGAVVWFWIDPSRAVWVAVSVLIVTCPCAFSLAAPAALVAAAGGLARRGVVFRRLEAIETLASVQQVFVDKTGTLTEDRLVLQSVRLQAGATLDEATIRSRVAGLAGWSQHPIAVALAQAGSREAAEQATWADVAEVAGQGLSGVDPERRRWRLGSWAWVGGTGRPVDPQARVWLSVDGVLQAGFVVEEVLREGTAAAIQGLKAQGLSVGLLTGDVPERARALADALGIDDVLAQATPEAKLDRVARAQREGLRVLMVGDGINDAPVLARADVSLAMGQGALVARSQADAVIASNRPLGLLLARRVAVRTVRIVRQNLLWAAVYNAVCIPLALAGLLPPWAAGLGMAGSSLLVVLNALRAAR